MQPVTDGQDTLPSDSRVTLAGWSIWCTDQVVPFQPSVTASVVLPLVTNPVAQHPGAWVLQDTPSRPLAAPVGTAGVCAVQLVPFQRSASGTPLGVLLT